MAVEINDISKMEIKNVSTGENEVLEDLWKDKSCVILFLRRWGCLYCRLWAKEVSQIAKTLHEKNIRLIGIGPEEVGVKEFAEGKYLDGELYVDVNKKVYSKLSFKRYNYFSILCYILSKEGRRAYQKGKASKLSWNLQGDYLQIGGALIVENGGKLLYSFRQTGAADHLPNEKILEVLDLASEIKMIDDNLDGSRESSPSDI
uniref:Prostamide/prostaglandin F synthase n=1 Tax=Clastoptera arizonana TaxID=38151 RepID=A0A1B6D4E4_9HEMI